MTATELEVVLRGRGQRVRRRPCGKGFVAQCPAHQDGKHMSLAVSIGRDGRQLMHCFAGCGFDEVRLALALPVEAFFGWDAYHKRLCRAHSGLPSLTLSISSHRVIDARALAAPAAVDGTAIETVAADIGALFAAADRAGVGDYPLMYSVRFGADRTGLHKTAVAKALKMLCRRGRLRRGPDVPARTGRSTHTYRRAGR